MILVFDTTALSALLNEDDQVIQAVAAGAYDRLVIPLAADAEIRFGFMNGNKETDNLQSYELFKQKFDVAVVFPDQDTAMTYAKLATWAKHHGAALSNNDFWIAAACMQL